MGPTTKRLYRVVLYTGHLAGTLKMTGLMILSAHQAAKKVAIEEVLAQDGDESDVLLDQQYEKDRQG